MKAPFYKCFYEMMLSSRLKVIKYTETDAMNRKTLNPSFKGAVVNYLTQVLHSNKLNYRDFTFKICREHFLLNPITIYFRKSSFLIDDAVDLISALQANGLIDYWISEYADSKYLKSSLQLSDHQPSVLSVAHMEGVFMVWIFGVAASTVLFVFEYWCRMKNCLN